MEAILRIGRGCVLCLFSTALLVGSSGCSRKTPAETDVSGGANRASDEVHPIVPDADDQICFACDGKGMAPCRAPGCTGGQIECPGSCLRLSRGKWEHMQVAGHGPNELWQKFPNGPGKWTSWNQNHVGEVIAIRDGKAVNLGKCPTCGGSTKVKCPVCAGSGQQTCEFCDGKKIVPATWTPTDNPVLNRQPDLIRFKDGRVLLGRVALKLGTKYTIKTRDGKTVEVDATEILPKTTSPQSGQLPPPSR